MALSSSGKFTAAIAVVAGILGVIWTSTQIYHAWIQPEGKSENFSLSKPGEEWRRATRSEAKQFMGHWCSFDSGRPEISIVTSGSDLKMNYGNKGENGKPYFNLMKLRVSGNLYRIDGVTAAPEFMYISPGKLISFGRTQNDDGKVEDRPHSSYKYCYVLTGGKLL